MGIVTHYKGVSKIYFDTIISNIIRIGNLETKNLILDYGCGKKRVQKKLKKKILNYDINPNYTDCNKIDNLEDIEPRIDRDDTGMPIRVWLSAHANIGIELFFQALGERLGKEVVTHSLTLPPRAGKFRAALYQLNCINTETYDDEGNCRLTIRLPLREWERLLKDDKSTIESFIET